MRPKIIVPNLIIKICGSLMTIGLIAANFYRILIYEGVSLAPFDIYMSIALLIMFTGLWIPLYSKYVIILEPKKTVKAKKEVIKHE